ncbi:hypothetical protein [Chryseobacterium gambrini]|uniref:hypothetical protein n=1 Tax=Chryseobacterium gambrini TaxID=373672 RepID=UPI0022F1C5A9|nr:hypothetical protein [Chryseobacterium gambrini]WBV54143.1 hypothetical protein PFY09_07380 [Chryseobacterium gambrini]
MKIKYFEYIAIYLSVFLLCILIGIFGRLKLIEKGADEYTANVFLWFCIGFGILMFAILSLFIDIVYKWVMNFFLNKKESGLTKSQVTTERNQKVTIEQEISAANIQPLETYIQITEDNNIVPGNNQNTDENTQILEVDTQNVISEDVKVFPLSDIEKIRTKARLREEEIIQEKLDFLVKYTQEKLALYISDEDLYRFCDYLVVFLKDGKIGDLKPIKITVLSTTDLKHFGWNVWNHYKGKNERKDVAIFLKKVFPQTFKGSELQTIEKQLTSRKNEGKIKIEENLLK